MRDEASPLETLAERFPHPAVRVMARELSHLARDLERGSLAWPRTPPALAVNGAALPGLESIEAGLLRQPADASNAVAQGDWASFARTVLGIASASPDANQPQVASGPHPAAVIALRLIWGAEHFSELPTVILKPPPASFLEQLTRLPAPERLTPPAQLDQAVSLWLQTGRALADQPRAPLAATDARGFARVVAACRVVGRMRQEITLEDAAAGYLAWARVLRANPQQLSDISSGWWSSTDRPPDRRP